MIYSLRAKMDAHYRPSEAGRAQNRNDHRFACIRHCRANVPKKDAVIGKKARPINPPRTRYLWRTCERLRRAAIPQEPSSSLLCSSWSLSIMGGGDWWRIMTPPRRESVKKKDDTPWRISGHSSLVAFCRRQFDKSEIISIDLIMPAIFRWLFFQLRGRFWPYPANFFVGTIIFLFVGWQMTRFFRVSGEVREING